MVYRRDQVVRRTQLRWLSMGIDRTVVKPYIHLVAIIEDLNTRNEMIHHRLHRDMIAPVLSTFTIV